MAVAPFDLMTLALCQVHELVGLDLCIGEIVVLDDSQVAILLGNDEVLRLVAESWSFFELKYVW